MASGLCIDGEARHTVTRGLLGKHARLCLLLNGRGKCGPVVLNTENHGELLTRGNINGLVPLSK